MGENMIRWKKRAWAVAITVAAAVLCSGTAASATELTGATNFASARNEALAIYNKVSSAQDPEAAFAALTADERSAFDSYFLPATSAQTVTLQPLTASGEPEPAGEKVMYKTEAAAMAAVAATSKCYAATARSTEYAALGNAIFDVWVEGKWCGTPGKKVTSATFIRSYSTIAAIGWRDAGQLNKAAGVVNSLGKVVAQRKLILGTGGWDVQEARPCVRLTGYPDGYYFSSNGCSIY